MNSPITHPTEVDWAAVGRILDAQQRIRGVHSVGTSNWGAAIWRAAIATPSPGAGGSVGIERISTRHCGHPNHPGCEDCTPPVGFGGSVGAEPAFAEAAALSAIVLPTHSPTIGIEEVLDEFEDREWVWEAITAYADVHARAAIALATPAPSVPLGGPIYDGVHGHPEFGTDAVSQSAAVCAVCGLSRHVAAHRPLVSGPNAGEPLDHAFTIQAQDAAPVEPLTTKEIADLTAMIWGAPVADNDLKLAEFVIRAHEAILKTGERPKDPADGGRFIEVPGAFGEGT